MSQLIFPNERDLGALITIQAPKISRWNWFKIDAGMFNGNAAPGAGQDVSDFDKKKDFIGHISINKSNLEETFKYGGGISYYNGGFRIDSIDVYSMSHEPGTDVSAFHLDSKKFDNYNKGLVDTRHFTKREYRGVDLQLVKLWTPGMTILRAEYIWGTQPGIKTDDSPTIDTRSPITSTPITKDVYNRKFNGAYFYFIQNIMQSPFQFVVKYDWYDPNVDVKGNDIGKTVSTSDYAATSASDLRYDTWGIGLIIHMDAGIKLMTYYEIVKNETSDKLTKYSSDKKDNVLTVRLQATF